MKVYQIANRQE